MMIMSPFFLELDSDVKKAKAILHDIVATSNYVFLKKPVKLLLTEENLGGRPVLRLLVKCYVLDVQYEKALETEIFEKANPAHRAAGISRPKISFIPSDLKNTREARA